MSITALIREAPRSASFTALYPARSRTVSDRSVGKSDVVELANALMFSQSTDGPLNFHVTIRWDFSEGFDPEPRAWMGHQGRFCEKVDGWKDRRGISKGHIWMREIGANNGHHTHFLMRLPADQVNSFIEFAMKAGGFREVYPGLLPVFVTGGRNAATTGAVSSAQQRGLLFYLLKSLPTEKRSEGVNIAQTLGIRTKANSSPVLGKPCGTHRSIGRKARQDAGWEDFTSLSALRTALGTYHV